MVAMVKLLPVSYTHLDVYKRQVPSLSVACDGLCVFYSMGKSVVVRPVSRIFIGTFSDKDVYKRQGIPCTSSFYGRLP